MSGLLLWLACAALAQQGDVHAEAGTAYYSSSEDLTVVSPWAGTSVYVSDEVKVGAGWQADVISSATVDVMTSATRSFQEVRNQGEANLLVDLVEQRFGAGYVHSNERDTATHLVTTNAELDFFQRTTTLAGAYMLGVDRLGTRHEPPELRRTRLSHNVDLTATQVLSRRSVVSGTYTFQVQRGFLSSAYRQVPLFPSAPELWDREHAAWVAERHPDSRIRQALTLQSRQSFTDRFFLRSSYRAYVDTWAMRSHAGELAPVFDLGRGILVEASDRLHWQSSVSFYRDVYTVNREFITRDRKLGELVSNITGLAVRPAIGPLEGLLKGEVHWTRYRSFYALDDGLVKHPDAVALVLQVGLDGDF